MDIFKNTKQIIDDNRPELVVGEGKGAAVTVSQRIVTEGLSNYKCPCLITCAEFAS